MKFDKSMYLKWIEPSKLSPGNLDLTLTNQGIIYSIENGRISGFTIFEPRDLNEFLFERLQKRVLRSDTQRTQFKMVVPPFVKHRIESASYTEIIKKVKIIFSPWIRIHDKFGKLEIQDRVRVVNVDDSSVMLKYLKNVFSNMGFIDVVEQVNDPTKAVEVILNTHPDFVTMDIQMPKMSGVEVVSELCKHTSLPIIMLSSLSMDDGVDIFNALNAGAFDYIQKPTHNNREEFQKEFEVKLLQALQGRERHSALLKNKTATSKSQVSAIKIPENLIWCLGSSTGGTQTITRILTCMPKEIPPLLIVQHMPPVFSKSFADSLNQLCPFTVKEAQDGDVLEKSHVYIAPGGFQMGVIMRSNKIYIRISDEPPVNRFKPSVDFLFHSIAKLKNYDVVAGILTGMGRDGAEGLLALKNNGAKTFAQDEATSIVYGMPRAAIENGATDLSIPVDDIAQMLCNPNASASKAGSF